MNDKPNNSINASQRLENAISKVKARDSMPLSGRLGSFTRAELGLPLFIHEKHGLDSINPTHSTETAKTKGNQMRNVLFIVLMVIVLLVSGCNEAQRPVYGQGNPPAQWQVMFGNSNGSRLDFLQNQAIVKLRDKTINELTARVIALEGDPNDVVVRVETLEVLALRGIRQNTDNPTEGQLRYCRSTKDGIYCEVYDGTAWVKTEVTE